MKNSCGNQNSPVVFIIPTYWWIPSTAVKSEIQKEKEACVSKDRGRQADDWGRYISFDVNKYPIWVICCSSPTEEFCPESQSASSPWHSYGTWTRCCLHVKHRSICVQNLKKLCFEHLRGERPETLFSEFSLRIWHWASFFSRFRFFPRYQRRLWL